MTTAPIEVRIWGEDAPLWLAPLLAVFGLAAVIVTARLFVPPEVIPLVSSSDATFDHPVGAGSSAVPEAVTAPASAVQATTSPKSITCPALSFGFESAAIDVSSSARSKVADLASWLVAHPTANVLVHGHSDAYGNDDANLALSRTRANTVSRQLVAAGVARSRITARGFGAYQPVEGVPEEAASNRRVVVYVKDTTECPTSSPGGMDR